RAGRREHVAAHAAACTARRRGPEGLNPMEATLPGPGPLGASVTGRVLRALAAIPAPPLGGLLAPADRVRSRLLRFFAPRARSLVVARDRRVALAASCLLLCALASSSVVPMWLLALGPIIWGVPHIVADVRYLVARPGYHRRPWIMAAIAAGIVAAGL